MLTQRERTGTSALTTYDLCLACTNQCKGIGLPWFKLECPSFSGMEREFQQYRVVEMTDEDLIARVAYG
jgi:hypothetical protein